MDDEDEPHARTRNAVASFFEDLTCCSSEHDSCRVRKYSSLQQPAHDGNDASLLQSGLGVGVGINFQQQLVANEFFLTVSVEGRQKSLKIEKRGAWSLAQPVLSSSSSPDYTLDRPIICVEGRVVKKNGAPVPAGLAL